MVHVVESHAVPQCIEHYLRSPQGHLLVLDFAKAVAQPSLSMGANRCIPIPLPLVAGQQWIASEVACRISLLRSIEVEGDADLKRTPALRQSVLSKSFSR